MYRLRILSTLILLFACIQSHAQNDKEARLLRFPAIYGQQVVFSYAGNLYTVSRTGGTARQLTHHEGFEMFPRFSPDGAQIAFTGQYDGNTEVYLMSAQGGSPKRVTYTATLGRDDVSDRMGPNNIVMTWRDQESIVFRSRMRSFNSFKGHLFSVSPEGTLPQQIPFSVGGWISWSPDKKKVAYNQVFREFRTWKYYKGGMADDIWIYDMKSGALENVTQNDAQDIFPMWHGNKVFFLSDRERTMNLYSYNTETREITKETSFTEFDIKFPSLGKDAIIFENGGYLHVYDIANAKTTKLEIFIRNDNPEGRTKTIADAKASQVSISPGAERVVISKRGEIFDVPVEAGVTRNLTRSPNVREKSAKWSPDGKNIAYFSDEGGKDGIWVRPANGEGEPKLLISEDDTYYFSLKWSPDSKYLLYADRKLRLSYIDIKTKKVVKVAEAEREFLWDSEWSPDGKWIVYSRDEWQSVEKLYLYNVASKQSTPVTKGWYASDNPVFSPDGKYLFFVSSRDFNPIYSRTEWNHAYRDMDRPYFLTLSKETPSLMEMTDPEVSTDKGEEDKSGDKSDSDKDSDKTMQVDFEGIADRIVQLPVKVGSYNSLEFVNGKLYYVFFDRENRKALLKSYDFKEKKEREHGEIYQYQLTKDRKKMVVAKQGKYALISVPNGKANIDKYISFNDVRIEVDRMAEWKQIFNEAHRQYKYVFYAPNMHGVDWDAMRDKYAPLVEHVRHRADLTYVIGEMIGEVNVGHAYVGNGDYPKAERVKTGLLGAEFSKDSKSGYFKIERLLESANWDENTHSPLREIGVNVKEGDFILAINGQSLKAVPNLFSLMVGLAGKQVELTVNTSASESGARKVLVRPIDDESGLYYYNWVQENIRKVNEATGGEAGYIHIPDMGVTGLNEFVKHFYPQLNKKALIIDDRGNGGGNVSPMIIERLNRELVMVNHTRNFRPSTNPTQMHLGPKVLLVDQYSASDGDLFAYRWRKAKLGPIIGRRTWGGVIGYRGTFGFVDGGYLVRPEFGPFGKDGEGWIIEGTGVSPDIEIFNDPAKEYQGDDQQLTRAIEEAKKLLKTDSKTLPEIPPYPKR